jgi:GntR family transcriptional regulator
VEHQQMPLYRQVIAALRNQIVTGQRSVGSMLPTEHELTEVFNVSRATVRRAIQGLREEGLIRARPGLGTVVVRKRPHRQYATLRRLNDDLEERGLASTVKLVSVQLEEPSDAVRENLHVANGDRVLHVTRLRTIAAQPFSLTEFYVPEWVGIGMDSDFSRPIHELVERTRQNFITHGTDRVSARAATDVERQALNMPATLPVLFVRRASFTDYDQPVEYIESAIRSDLFDYMVTLPREL